VKAFGTAGGTAVFLWAYFWVLRNPRGEVAVIPATWLDELIGVQPWSFPLYASLWVYISFGTALARDMRELAAFGWASLGMGLTGLAIFILAPTRVPDPDVDWALYPSLQFLKSMDASGNAFPSLHAAFCVFTGLALRAQLRSMAAPRSVQGANALWCLGILYSTIATGQHVVFDALAGAALGTAAAVPYLRVLGAPRPAG
jgi:membrane-associated phospholipid phosphatase